MNIMKMVTGLWALFWILFVLFTLMPVWALIFAYDLGSPKDGVDRTGIFIAKACKMGGVDF